MSRHDPLPVEIVGGVAVVRFDDNKLEESNIHVVSQQLIDLIDQHKRLHLDFGNVRYITSMGLGKLVGLHKKLHRAGGHLTLCNVTDPVYEVLKVTRLDQLLEVRRQVAS